MTVDEAPMLPGLEPAPTGAAEPGRLEQAVRQTIQAIAELTTLDGRSAARCALALELASVIAEKRRSGRMSTIGNDARVLVELLDRIAPVDEDDVDERLKAVMDEWSATVAGLAGLPVPLEP